MIYASSSGVIGSFNSASDLRAMRRGARPHRRWLNLVIWLLQGASTYSAVEVGDFNYQ